MRRHAPPWVAVVAALLATTACTSDETDPALPVTSATTAADDATSAPTTGTTRAGDPFQPTMATYPVPSGSRPHDVWAASDGTVWYSGQGAGVLGVLDPGSREVREVPLGTGSRPHGVIEGPDGAAWITDGGLNAIVRVDTATDEVTVFALPSSHPDANLNTATFDADGTLWFTGQAGVYGRLPAGADEVEAFDAPGGRGPYGITAASTPSGDAVYYASLAGSHVARVDPDTADVTRLDPPTPDQGTRRVWADSTGRIWSSQWNAGQVAVYDPAGDSWQEWPLPGAGAQAYAVFVDDRDIVWLSDFTADAVVSFDPTTETTTSYPLPGDPGEVRQIHGRPGEVWLPESAADQLVVLRTAP